MIKRLALLILLSINYAVILPNQVLAKNIFGLHLTQTEDIESASKIINSSGGKWGWATIVIRLDQLNRDQWQNFFNKCRRLHIIPIVRLATKFENNQWQIPSFKNIDDFSYFLHSLDWPTLQKHVILFNEVNRAEEWGGQVDPHGYVDISIYASQKLTKLDTNFVILSSGLDLAAPNKPPNFMGADTFYRQILEYKPDFFDFIHGLSSHSYPNHGFVGKPTDTGRLSIKGYHWELEYLRSLGVKKNLSVYITETGWPHREGIVTNNNYYTANTSVDFLKKAINIWQQDEKVIAVTPFTYNYPQHPFSHFSWLDENNQLYSAYQEIVSLEKQTNDPNQINTYNISKINLPLIIFPNHLYQAKLNLKNTGQAIWGPDDTSFCLNAQSTQNVILGQVCTNPSISTEPGQHQTIEFTFQINTETSLPRTIIGWQQIEQVYELKPIVETIPIFRPRTNLLTSLIKIFTK